MRVSACVEFYVQKKRDCGYDYGGIAKLLRRFAKFVGRLDISRVTATHVDRFLANPAISNNTSRIYAWQLRNFFKYWHGRQQLPIVPQISVKPATNQEFVPYVYTRQEIRALVDAVTVCQKASKCYISPLTLKTLILFLYGTGIKVGDALSILDGQLDLSRSTIIVRGNTVLKRTLPIGNDIKELLNSYLKSAERERFASARFLFLNRKGGRIEYSTLRHAFNRLRKASGVKRADSSYQPRMQDLRHSFAVHSIAKSSQSGLDLDHVLPILATYMGNVDMHGLERYLELSPCNYENTLKRLFSFRGPSVHRKRA